jgi:hypothetical protein
MSSKTGTLVLDSWHAVRKPSRHEGEDMLEQIDAAFAWRVRGRGGGSLDGGAHEPSSRIEQVFGGPRVLLPVVHPIDQATALASVQVACDAGVKGVFLINQGMTSEDVLALVMTVRERWPALWVGINLLGEPPPRVLSWGLQACDRRLDGIWADNGHVEEGAETQPVAMAMVNARRTFDWAGLYFGGVAFKYQREVPTDSLARAAAMARPYMDVVCTSGPGTGKAADVAKVIAMRDGLGRDGSLALASGVTADNVAGYLPYVDAYLVGTGIERSFGVLDPDKVARLQAIISAYEPR